MQGLSFMFECISIRRLNVHHILPESKLEHCSYKRFENEQHREEGEALVYQAK